MTIKQKNNLTLYTIGSVGYSLIEILWRGFTHWSMALTGGLCFTLLHKINLKMKREPMWKKCLAGSLVITSIEFLVGCIVNLCLHLNVWNYKDQKGNILGQICPLYTILWFLLCIPVLSLSNCLKRHSICNK